MKEITIFGMLDAYSALPNLLGRINFDPFSTNWNFFCSKHFHINTSNVLIATCWTPCKKAHFFKWSSSRYTCFNHSLHCSNVVFMFPFIESEKINNEMTGFEKSFNLGSFSFLSNLLKPCHLQWVTAPKLASTKGKKISVGLATSWLFSTQYIQAKSFQVVEIAKVPNNAYWQ